MQVPTGATILSAGPEPPLSSDLRLNLAGVALVEVLREQLRSQLGPFIDERPQALGILPDFVVLLFPTRLRM